MSALKAHTFTKNEYIVKEGEQGDRFYIVTQGEVVITKLINGVETVITHLYEVCDMEFQGHAPIPVGHCSSTTTAQ